MCNPGHHYLSAQDAAGVTEAARTCRGFSGKASWWRQSVNTEMNLQLMEKRFKRDVHRAGAARK